MIKYILIGFLSIALSSKAQIKKNENSLLWEISGNGLQKPSYLFGTYHYAGKDFIDTMKVLNAKLNQADIIVGELVIDSTLTKKLVPFMIMTDNSLDKLLSPTEYQKVAGYLKKVSGYELKTYNIMKPVTVQMTILQFLAPKSNISETNPALDKYIQDYGNANRKIVVGLETAEDQANLLFGSSLERQKELLLKSISDEKQSKKQSQKLYDDYIAQDLKSLEKTFKNISDYSQEESDALLKTRNAKWMTQIPDLMQNGSLFIAVGAGHLVGQDGLINALRNKGFRVNPLATN